MPDMIRDAVERYVRSIEQSLGLNSGEDFTERPEKAEQSAF